MKKLKLFIIAAIVVSAASGAFIISKTVSAQTNNCSVAGPAYRVNKGAASDPTFYEESDRPYVYIDIQTQNCIGTAIQFSLTGQTGGGSTGSIGEMDNRIVTIGQSTNGQPNFTIVMRAGEENCSAYQTPNCQYFVEVVSSNMTPSSSSFPDLFQYSCYDEGAFDFLTCADGSDWTGFQIIPYTNSLTIDPHFTGVNPVPNTVDTTPAPTPDDPEGPSVIDIDIPNPLAGTVDSIPGLFERIVNIIITIGVPLVAMAIVYSGFLFVAARGSDENLKKAKNVFTYAIIGGLVLLASWLIAEAIRDALTTLAYVI